VSSTRCCELLLSAELAPLRMATGGCGGGDGDELSLRNILDAGLELIPAGLDVDGGAGAGDELLLLTAPGGGGGRLGGPPLLSLAPVLLAPPAALGFTAAALALSDGDVDIDDDTADGGLGAGRSHARSSLLDGGDCEGDDVSDVETPDSAIAAAATAAAAEDGTSAPEFTAADGGGGGGGATRIDDGDLDKGDVVVVVVVAAATEVVVTTAGPAPPVGDDANTVGGGGGARSDPRGDVRLRLEGGDDGRLEDRLAASNATPATASTSSPFNNPASPLAWRRGHARGRDAEHEHTRNESMLILN
jgi:hypothetical protein